MTETQTVCERNASGDFSQNQRVLNELHLYYSGQNPCGLALENPDLFVFVRTYRDYHQVPEGEVLPRVQTYFDSFKVDRPLPSFVARQFDLLMSAGKIQKF